MPGVAAGCLGHLNSRYIDAHDSASTQIPPQAFFRPDRADPRCRWAARGGRGGARRAPLPLLWGPRGGGEEGGARPGGGGGLWGGRGLGGGGRGAGGPRRGGAALGGGGGPGR